MPFRVDKPYKAPGSRSEKGPGAGHGRRTLDDLGPAEPGVKVIDLPTYPFAFHVEGIHKGCN